MSKEAYYFSHDANARHDPKILAMRSEFGLTGYGLYWVIVEMLREQDEFKLPLKKYIWKAIAMQMDANALQNNANEMQSDATEFAQKFVEKCVNDYDLFASDDAFFWSESLRKRMQKKNTVSEKRREAAKKRWDKSSNDADSQKNDDANAMQMYANAMQSDAIKEKESKEKESIKNISSSDDNMPQNEFETFWEIYQKKTDKKKSLEKFKAKRKQYSFEEIMNGTARYMKKCQAENTDKKYIKGPAVFLNGDCFLEDWEIYQNKSTNRNNKNNGGVDINNFLSKYEEEGGSYIEQKGNGTIDCDD